MGSVNTGSPCAISLSKPNSNGIKNLPSVLNVSEPVPGNSRQVDWAPTNDAQIVNTFKWSPISFRSVHKLPLIIMIQAVSSSLLEGNSDKKINNFLKVEKEKLKISSSCQASELGSILRQIPENLPTCIRKLGLDAALTSLVCCPSCFTLYPLPGKPEPDSNLELAPKSAPQQDPRLVPTHVRSAPEQGIRQSPWRGRHPTLLRATLPKERKTKPRVFLSSASNLALTSTMAPQI
ncbi:hypothetical protein VP01_544g5 [Puccinia sorghi]|uniref:Uncharacterized protein n=1 Tax=Puccinia sorghi TaxID=27349 RepID=A0A0L6UKC4_9BASI|nr:hypothetical protein VP01_544g5 [Puccinia sorghi]